MRNTIIAAITTAGLTFTGTAGAAAVTYVGADTTTGGSWRTTTVAKPLDADLNNVYGSDGYVAYAVSTVGTAGGVFASPTDPLSFSGNNGDTGRQSDTLKSLPAYLSLANNGQNSAAGDYGYPAIDNPTLAPGASVADVEGGLALRFPRTGTLLNITIADNAPAVLRVGVLGVGAGNDAAESFTLAQTAGVGSASATATGQTTPVVYYFFDIVGAQPGDVFTLSGTKNASLVNDNVGYLGLSFDSVVPEPASATTIFTGLLGAALLTRRSRHGSVR